MIEPREKPDVARNGMIADNGPRDIMARNCKEFAGINFGRIVADYDSIDKSCRLPLANKVSFEFMTALASPQSVVVNITTTNVVTGVETVQATASVPWDTNVATTMAAIKTAVEGLNFIASGAATVSANKITVDIDEPNQVTAITAVVTGGTLPTVNYVFDTNDKFIGLSVEEMKQPNSAGQYQYDLTDTVQVGKKIREWIICKTAFTKKSNGYVMLTGANRGFLRTDNADSNSKAWTAIQFLSTGSADGLALVEISLP